MTDNAFTVAPNLHLPVEAVTSTFAIVGKRGSGKTHTGSVMAEEMLAAEHRLVIVDPLGVWWGLRSSADGDGPGYPVVILGGEHADLPIDDGGGEVIADLVVDTPVPVILDLSEFRKGAARKFLTAFMERVYQRNRDPLHVFVDECDLYAGQRPPKGGERLLGAMEDLVRRGRNRGLGVTLVSQRPAVIHKDVLTQAETLIAHRLTGSHDRDAVDAWVRYHSDGDGRKAMLSTIASLDVGEAWVWSPGWLDIFDRFTIRPRHTFDSSATPSMGRQVDEPTGYADVDLDALQERMSEVIEQAEADDPAALRRRIAELERQLANVEPETVEVPTPVVDDRAVEVVDGLTRALGMDGDAIDSFAQDIENALMGITDAVSRSRTTLGDAKEMIRDYADDSPAVTTFPQRRRGSGVRGGASGTPVPAPAPDDADPDARVRAGARRMLEALARPPGVKLTRAQVGTLAGLTPSGGTFNTYLSDLRTAGLIEEDGDAMRITDAGLDAIGEVPPAPRTTDEVVAMWRSNLRAGARRMLDAVVEAWPDAISREELAERADLTANAGTFNTYLSTLRRNGLVDVDGDTVVGADALFMGAA